MCQSNAYLVQDDREELLAEDAVLIKPEGEKNITNRHLRRAETYRCKN